MLFRSQGPLFIAVHGPLTVVASLVAEHGLQTHRLSSCGSRAQFLRGMWDLPRPGLEPVSLALAGRFSTTAPPGKPGDFLMKLMKLTFQGPVILLGLFLSRGLGSVLPMCQARNTKEVTSSDIKQCAFLKYLKKTKELEKKLNRS